MKKYLQISEHFAKILIIRATPFWKRQIKDNMLGHTRNGFFRFNQNNWNA